MNDREKSRREPGVGHRLTKENMLFTLPMALRGDKSIVALADAAAELLSRRPEEIERLRIYPVIDQLDEKLLDILARDFKVDWWDADYSLGEKRQTMKDSWRVHKILGTKTAVETAIRAIYPDTTVKRWFEYEGGRPYYFKLYIDLSAMKYDEVRPWRVIEKVNFYKSLRDHIDRIEFTVKPKEDAILRLGGYMSTQIRLPVPELPDSYDLQNVVRIGGNGTVTAKVPVPELEDNYNFQGTVHIGGTGTVVEKLPVPETADNYRFQGAVRIGGAGTVVEKLPVPETADNYRFQGDVRIGGAGTIEGKMPVPEAADNYDFQGAVRVGGDGTAASRMPVPEDTTAPPLKSKGRTGGQPAVRFTLPVPELE